MKTNALCFAVLLILLLSSCKGGSSSKEKGLISVASSADADTLIAFPIEEIIDAPGKYHSVEMSNLSYYTDSIGYIVLGSKNEQGEECYIKKVMGVSFSEQYIFVNCVDRVLKFDRKGNFICRIGSQGQGPEEFVSAEELRVDEKEKTLYIGTRLALLKYSFDGAFLGRISLKQEFDKAIPLGAGVFAFGFSNTYGSLSTKLLIQKENGDTLQLFPNYVKFTSTGQTLALYGDPYGEVFYQYQGDTYYHEEYNDTVFRITDKFELQPRYVFKLGKYSAPAEARIEALGDAKKVAATSSNYYKVKLLDADGFAFIEYSSLNDGIAGNSSNGFIAYNKRTKETKFISSPSVMKYFEAGFENDIDGGYLFKPEGVLPDGRTLYRTFIAATLQSVLEKKGYREDVKRPELQQKLKTLVSGLNETDNMVIMFAKLK